MNEPQTLKEEGNGHFKAGNYKEAAQCYTQALAAGSVTDIDKAIVYKNRAQCKLKLNDNLGAIDDCSASLELVENDPKALFRRSQAYEALGKVDAAFRDIVTLIKVDPKNLAAASIYQRLNPIMQEKVKQQTGLNSKVSQMFNLAFDASVTSDKRSQAFNNLVVLSREEAGANLIVHEGGVSRLVQAIKEKQDTAIVGAVKVLACLCKNSQKRAAEVEKAIDLNLVMTLLGQGSAEVNAAVTHLVQMLLNWHAGLEDFVQAVKQG